MKPRLVFRGGRLVRLEDLAGIDEVDTKGQHTAQDFTRQK